MWKGKAGIERTTVVIPQPYTTASQFNDIRVVI